MNQRITFTVMNGPWDGKAFTFRDRAVVTVGRAEDCQVRLNYLDVSRHHCLLDIAPPHVTIRDLGSCNGTHVNGCNIGQHTQGQGPKDSAGFSLPDQALQHGDVVRIGSVLFRVTISEPAKEFVPSGELADKILLA